MNKEMRKRYVSLALTLVAFALAAQSGSGKGRYDIGNDLGNSLESWEQSADDFAVEYGKIGFRFAGNKKRDVVVCRDADAINCFGFSVMESRVYFKNRKVDRVELSLFNKGDAAKDGVAMSVKELEKKVEAISLLLNGGSRKMPQIRRVRVKNDRAKMGHKFTRAWPDRKPAAELTWGISGEDDSRSVEYFSLELRGVQESASKVRKTGTRKAAVGAARFMDNVKRNDEGDVYVANVPMVDQGDKGYCSVAAAERVLRYFGQDIDEHEIAQMAGTHAQGGTSTKAMISAVETIGKRCKLGKREVVAKISGWDDIGKQLKEYNKCAKRMKKPELNFDDFVTIEGNTRIFNVGKMQQMMEAKVVKSMSMRDKSGFAKFLKGIREQTKRGVPLFWSVQLGLYPEAGVPQVFGGHMRLIIGYNEEKNEIIYTDTWGAGHEHKYMPDDWAWTITQNMFDLNPR